MAQTETEREREKEWKRADKWRNGENEADGKRGEMSLPAECADSQEVERGTGM